MTVDSVGGGAGQVLTTFGCNFSANSGGLMFTVKGEGITQATTSGGQTGQCCLPLRTRQFPEAGTVHKWDVVL